MGKIYYRQVTEVRETSLRGQTEVCFILDDLAWPAAHGELILPLALQPKVSIWAMLREDEFGR